MNEVKKKDNSGCWWFLVMLGVSVLVALSNRDGSSSINTEAEDPTNQKSLVSDKTRVSYISCKY